MARLRDYIGLLIFSILCVSALFMQSHSFTDSYIVPKWLITKQILQEPIQREPP